MMRLSSCAALLAALIIALPASAEYRVFICYYNGYKTT